MNSFAQFEMSKMGMIYTVAPGRVYSLLRLSSAYHERRMTSFRDAEPSTENGII